ncbi:MAG: hypothetical protein AAGI07_03795 [Bacteroidota bacterium]
MKRLIVRFVFDVIKEIFTEEIDEKYIRERLLELSDHLRKAVKALLDRNKNDKTQLLAIWIDARPGLVQWGLKEAHEEIDQKVQDAEKRIMYKNWLNELANTLDGRS